MRNRIFPPERCPAPDDWHALLSGELPSTRIAELEAHLDGCPVCVAQLDGGHRDTRVGQALLRLARSRRAAGARR
jgi:anti-sigma factor RsiW